ncbi:gephyrin-like molybdotransferase Glp [Brevibacillus sp. H7]|uniref:molybdopterin molybdotransferase MoeA n=1 Tax=Brevibacillus sp. H7 TaxID=3349138 RepID=UPI0037FA78FA
MRFHRQTIHVDEAAHLLLAEDISLPEEEVDIHEAYGRTVARDLYATCDLPPFDRSPLDGFAVRAADTRGATVDQPVFLSVVETIAAGQVPQAELVPGTASRIMTGAMLPKGADAVVMFEQTVHPGTLSPLVGVKKELKPGENISRRGEELCEGTKIAAAGELINAGTLALLATFGCTRIPVVRKPRIGLLATGSELLDADQPLVPGKIRNSNGVMLSAMIAEAGGIPVWFGRLPDDLTKAKRALENYMEQVDAMITTGGVSVGDFDVIASLTDEPDVKLLFNRVAMRPGSPTTAAVFRDKLLLGLSGNPGACFLGFELFGRPFLAHMLRQRDQGVRKIRAVLATSYEKPCPYPRFLRGRLMEKEAVLYAYPDCNDKSGNLSTLKESECFIVIPAGGRGKQAGETVDVIPHRSPSWSRKE